MFQWIDGKPKILNFAEVEALYYESFIKEFDNISISQWRGSYEYQCIYPAIQLMIENGAMTQIALDETLKVIHKINLKIKRPAVLVSRATERLLEAGYIASIREATQATRGEVALCIDYTQTPEDDEKIASLIINELLPAGQFMIGAISHTHTMSNNQQMIARWSLPTEHAIKWKLEITRDRNSQNALPVADDIRDLFLKNFKEICTLGMDVIPDKYLQISKDAPYASKIEAFYSLDKGANWTQALKQSVYTDKYNATLDSLDILII